MLIAVLALWLLAWRQEFAPPSPMAVSERDRNPAPHADGAGSRVRDLPVARIHVRAVDGANAAARPADAARA